jgi:hypothetical protein
MPALDPYNTQTDISLLRQHKDYDHWYDSFSSGLAAYHSEKSKKPKPPESEIQKFKKQLAKGRSSAGNKRL